ncbi:hypothetical protein SUSAZ_08020 [Sulfolobus acidocaldarius SUSAZ]|nr:hypothetical protein SUSAZ_08020 [Sulfolobus acidocaldarius SUSAZ]
MESNSVLKMSIIGAPRSSRKVLTLTVKGLPPDVLTKVVVNGLPYYLSNETVTFIEPIIWKASKVIKKNKVYEPIQSEGSASPPDNAEIVYRETSTIPEYWLEKKIGGKYKVSKILGSGGAGYVLLAEDKQANKYAVKIYRLESENHGETALFRDSMIELANNINKISKLDHPKLIKFYDVNVNLEVIKSYFKGITYLYLKDPPYVAMEYMGNGTVKDLLLRDEYFYSVRWKKLVYRIIFQVARGLLYLHSEGYVHLDVKPSNIFIESVKGDDIRVKLGDLDSMKRVGQSILEITPEYAPPEQLQAHYTKEGARPTMDIFSLGITFYELLTRKKRQPNYLVSALEALSKGNHDEAKKLINDDIIYLSTWNIDSIDDDKIKDLIQRMVSPDPKSRPTAKEVVYELDDLLQRAEKK